MAGQLKKVLAPRVPTVLGTPRVGPTTAPLPDELLKEQVARLAAFSAVMAALWGYGLLMELAVLPLMLGIATTASGALVETAAIVTSAAMHVYVKYANHTVETKKAVGLGYMVANAFGIGLINTVAMAHSIPELSLIHI